MSEDFNDQLIRPIMEDVTKEENGGVLQRLRREEIMH
jgi:hypothetical protein